MLLGVPAACRENFRVFTFRICFMKQPAGRYTYCQSKAIATHGVFSEKISPYIFKLLGRPVENNSILGQGHILRRLSSLKEEPFHGHFLAALARLNLPC